MENAAPVHELELTPLFGPGARLGCTAAAAVFVMIILAFIHGSDVYRGTISLLALFNPLVWIEAFLLVVLLPYFYLASRNPRPTLRLRPGRPEVGQECELRWSFSGRAARIRELSVYLIGREEAKYRSGTDTRTDSATFYHRMVTHCRSHGDIARGGANLILPDLMHSWPLHRPLDLKKEMGRLRNLPTQERHTAMQALHRPQHDELNNRIVWKLRLHGTIAFWPDVDEEFEFIMWPKSSLVRNGG